MNIPLGVIVKDVVTGFTGVAENRASFLYGCDRYCVQPKVGEDGKIPEPQMIDEPQLEIVDGESRVMTPRHTPKQLVELGQVVVDPIRGMTGTVIGRAVYLNGCSRLAVQPKQDGDKEKEIWWVDEEQVQQKNKFFGKKKTVDTRTSYTGGPALSSSKY